MTGVETAGTSVDTVTPRARGERIPSLDCLRGLIMVLRAPGYLFGKVLVLERERRIRVLLWSGAALALGFVVLRYLNVYGDPSPWFRRSTCLRTFLAFINTTKYPPSLSFLLMTLGPGILLMGLIEKRMPRFTDPLTVLGGVPMFFYLVHFPVPLGATVLIRSATGAADIAFAY